MLHRTQFLIPPINPSTNSAHSFIINHGIPPGRTPILPRIPCLFSPCRYAIITGGPVPNFTIPVPCCPSVICDSKNNSSAGCTARSYVSRPSRKALLKTSFHPAGCKWRQCRRQACRRMVRQFHNTVQYAPLIRPKAGQSGFQLRAGHCTRYP